MALENFTTEESPLESFERESQQILARELLAEMPTTARTTNGESSLTDDFIEFSLEDTQSLYGATASDTGSSVVSCGDSGHSGYDLPVEAQAGRHDAGPATEQLSLEEMRGLLQSLQEFDQLQDFASLPDRAPKAVPISQQSPAQLDHAAASHSASHAAAPGSGGDSIKQVSQLMQGAAPMMESLAPVLQEVLPQLIEQVGPIMEEVLPMLTEAAGSLASAI